MWLWKDELPNPTKKYEAVWEAQKDGICDEYIWYETIDGLSIAYLNYKGTNIFSINPKNRHVHLFSNTYKTMAIINAHCEKAETHIPTNYTVIHNMNSKRLAKWLSENTAGKTEVEWLEYLKKDRR